MFIGNYGMPGSASAVFSTAKNILWGGDDSRIKVTRSDKVFLSSCADAGNTPTNVLRPGLILAADPSTSKMVPWAGNATDGTEWIVGVNEEELKMVNFDGTALERMAPIYVAAPVVASQLLIAGSSLVGHADEYLARRLLCAQGFVLDDDPQGFLGITSESNRRWATVATDTTVVAADQGKIFAAITANATFTLPAIKAGLKFTFIRCSDHNLVVTSAEGDNVVVGNDLSADSVTWSTSGNKIGAAIEVEGRYLNGTLKWFARIIPAPFSTGAFLTQGLAT